MKKLLLAAVAACAVTSGAQAATFNSMTGAAPIVIAHRGASGYLPEHTLGGYELAIKLGAAYIEPDLLLTSDGHLVAMHDTTLTRTTNVREVFPGRASYAVGAFTLAEIKQLTVVPSGGQAAETYPGFTPSMDNAYKIPTFEEVLGFLTEYNAANGTNVGVYPEAKKPVSGLMHQQIVEQLRDAGFTDAADKAFIQSFSFQALRDIGAIQDDLGMSLLQVALGTPVLVDGVFSLRETGVETLSLAEIALIADGVGISVTSAGATAEFIQAAHDLGLLVHGYTLRPLTQDASDELTARLALLGYDGFFTDYTDRTLASIEALTPAPVPLPAPALLLVAGLGALVLRARRAA